MGGLREEIFGGGGRVEEGETKIDDRAARINWIKRRTTTTHICTHSLVK